MRDYIPQVGTVIKDSPVGLGEVRVRNSTGERNPPQVSPDCTIDIEGRGGNTSHDQVTTMDRGSGDGRVGGITVVPMV